MLTVKEVFYLTYRGVESFVHSLFGIRNSSKRVLHRESVAPHSGQFIALKNQFQARAKTQFPRRPFRQSPSPFI
jgi:hypothetical protein